MYYFEFFGDYFSSQQREAETSHNSVADLKKLLDAVTKNTSDMRTTHEEQLATIKESLAKV